LRGISYYIKNAAIAGGKIITDFVFHSPDKTRKKSVCFFVTPIEEPVQHHTFSYGKMFPALR